MMNCCESSSPARRHQSSGWRRSAICDLRDAGVEVSLRADPLIYRVTDSPGQLAGLFAPARDAGAGAVAVSYLFLRPMISRILRRRLAESELLDRILAPYEHGDALGIRGGAGRGLMLPAEIRRRAFAGDAGCPRCARRSSWE